MTNKKAILILFLVILLAMIACSDIYPTDSEGNVGTHFSHGVSDEVEWLNDAIDSSEAAEEGKSNTTE